MSTTDIITPRLRSWAKGSYPLEAAVELLVRAFGGRFAHRGNPWVEDADSDRPWINAKAMTDDELGALSGGERRFLHIVRSLAGGEPVDLNNDVPGLDCGLTQLVLAAISHAAGSQEHHGEPILHRETGAYVGIDVKTAGSLYPWPAT